jgi:hypothetical protein
MSDDRKADWQMLPRRAGCDSSKEICNYSAQDTWKKQITQNLIDLGGTAFMRFLSQENGIHFRATGRIREPYRSAVPRELRGSELNAVKLLSTMNRIDLLSRGEYNVQKVRFLRATLAPNQKVTEPHQMRQRPCDPSSAMRRHPRDR